MSATHAYAGITTGYVKAKADIHSYDDAEAFLDGQQQKQLASNVIVRRLSPTSIAIRLYNTDILVYHSDGTFEADNGGYNTPTTSGRCNQFGPRNYHFSHAKKKLVAWNGEYHATGKGVRLRYKEANNVP